MIVKDLIKRENIFNLMITIDVDSDFFDSALSPHSNRELQWKGISKGIPLLIETFQKYRDSFDNPIKIIWFVRVDNQIKELYGNAAYLLNQYKDTWKMLLRRGDEIGWHPHLYRKSGENWIQETRHHHISKDLQESYMAMIEEGFSPICSRIGEAFQSNEIMSDLWKLGIKIDSTAMPGRVRMDNDRKINWSGTPQHAYYPSMSDYRLPAEGEDRVGILEFPMSMVETRTEYDKIPLKRYVDLSFRNSIIRDGLKSYIRTNDHLVSITHPSSVFPLSESTHPLISFDINEVEENLKAIMSECIRGGKKIRSLTFSEYLDNNELDI